MNLREYIVNLIKESDDMTLSDIAGFLFIGNDEECRCPIKKECMEARRNKKFFCCEDVIRQNLNKEIEEER